MCAIGSVYALVMLENVKVELKYVIIRLLPAAVSFVALL